MTIKILQHNGETVYSSPFWLLTLEETSDEKVQSDKRSFKETTEEHLGTKLTNNELEDVGILETADEDKNDMIFTDLNEEIMHEAGDEYASAAIMLPNGSHMVLWHCQGT